MSEKVRRISIRIADVTYTLVSSEPESAIQRAVESAERLVESIRSSNPSLSLSASTVLALVNATGDRERLADELLAAESKATGVETMLTALRREIAGLKEQNTILLMEIRRAKRTEPEHVPPEEAPLAEETASPAEPPRTPQPERHTEGNITFILDPRIMASDDSGQEPPADPPPPHEEIPHFIQTGIEDLLTDD